MIGISWREFVDDAYFGIECLFRFRGKKYFYEGYYEEEHQPYAYRCYLAQWNNETNYLEEEILDFYSSSLEERFKKFLKAKVFDGKTIEEVEAEIEFLEWC